MGNMKTFSQKHYKICTFFVDMKYDTRTHRTIWCTATYWQKKLLSTPDLALFKATCQTRAKESQ